MKKSFVLLLISLSWVPVPATAISGIGTTAATFLKIGVGSRAVAMGESYVAVADDPSAIYWNPAGLALMEQSTLSAMHVFWLEDIYYDYLAAAVPAPFGVLGASLIYLNSGDIIRSEAGDTPDDPARGLFTAADIAFTGAYGYRFSKKMVIGASIKILSESIDAQTSLGFAMDIGFLYQLPWDTIRLGVLIQNLGPATKVDEEFFRMPLNFKFGFSFNPFSELLLSLDYNQMLEQYGKIALGVEYLYEETVALRMGYQYQGKMDQSELYTGFGSNTLAGISAGIGVNYKDLKLDYAYVPYGFLGATHRITLTYKIREREKVIPKPTPQPTPTVTAMPTPALAMAVEVLEQRIEEIERQINKGVLKSVQFKSGSAELVSSSKKTLDVIGKELKNFSELFIRIEGHTDSYGRTDDNLLLSQERVDNVKAYLVVKHGLNDDNLQATGYGESKPIASNETASGRRKNRRVEFKVLMKR